MDTSGRIDKLVQFVKENQHHIIGRRGMTNAEVLIPFVKQDDGDYLLFEKRSSGISQGSEICFPGGEVQRSTDVRPGDAAVRETVEELGIDKERISLVGHFGTIMVLRGIVVDCFVGMVNVSGIDELVHDPVEVERPFLLPLERFINHPPEKYFVKPVMQSVVTEEDGSEKILFPARQLNLPEKYWQSWSGKMQPVLHYETEEGPIWGMTAEIISELVECLTECRD